MASMAARSDFIMISFFFGAAGSVWAAGSDLAPGSFLATDSAAGVAACACGAAADLPALRIRKSMNGVDSGKACFSPCSCSTPFAVAHLQVQHAQVRAKAGRQFAVGGARLSTLFSSVCACTA